MVSAINHRRAMMTKEQTARREELIDQAMKMGLAEARGAWIEAKLENDRLNQEIKAAREDAQGHRDIARGGGGVFGGMDG